MFPITQQVDRTSRSNEVVASFPLGRMQPGRSSTEYPTATNERQSRALVVGPFFAPLSQSGRSVESVSRSVGQSVVSGSVGPWVRPDSVVHSLSTSRARFITGKKAKVPKPRLISQSVGQSIRSDLRLSLVSKTNVIYHSPNDKFFVALSRRGPTITTYSVEQK
jgi:hypothetical protein